MATSEINILVRLQDEASKAIAGISGSLKSLEPQFKKIAGVGAVGFAGITAIAGTSIKAFAESEAQLAKVDQNIRNVVSSVGGNFQAMSDEARKFGGELQRLGGIGDEAGAEGFSKLLLVAGGDTAEAAKLARMAADLSIAKNIDYATAVKTVSMVQAGQTRVLKEYGITLDENATKEEANQALLSAVGGQYEVYGKTITGQTEIMKQSFGDLQESIGQALAPVMTDLLAKLTPIIDKVMAWITANPELTKNIILVVGAISGLLVVIGTLGLVLPAIIAGASALGTAFLFMTGPIGLIILAIGALIAIGYLIYTHWEEIKQFFIKYWAEILIIFTGPLGLLVVGIVKNWELIKNSTKAIWGGISDFFKSVWSGITGIFDGAISAIQSKLEKLSGAIQRVKDSLAEIGGKVSGGVKSSISGLKGLIGLADGGIVTKPTVAMIGEGGEPEAVIPLSKLAGMGAGGGMTVVLQGTFMTSSEQANYFGDMLATEIKRTLRI